MLKKNKIKIKNFFPKKKSKKKNNYKCTIKSKKKEKKKFKSFSNISGTLPESPPDSGSEPPYSPADLHVINNLNQIVYHQQHPYLTQQQQQHTTANQHHLDQAMHTNDTSNVNCHVIGTSNGTNHSTPSSIHKTEDILLSSTAAMHLPNSVSNMMLSGGAGASDIMMHQNVS